LREQLALDLLPLTNDLPFLFLRQGSHFAPNRTKTADLMISFCLWRLPLLKRQRPPKPTTKQALLQCPKDVVVICEIGLQQQDRQNLTKQEKHCFEKP
jgi:hypothetical protein